MEGSEQAPASVDILSILETRRFRIAKYFNTSYHRFMSNFSSQVLSIDELEKLSSEKTSDKFVTLLITKARRNNEMKTFIERTLSNMAEDEDHVILKFLFHYGEIPNEKELKLFGQILIHFMKIFLEKVEVNPIFLNLLFTKNIINFDNIEQIRILPCNSEKAFHLVLKLPYRNNEFYPHLLHALCQSKQTSYIYAVHYDLYKELESVYQMKVESDDCYSVFKDYCQNLYQKYVENRLGITLHENLSEQYQTRYSSTSLQHITDDQMMEVDGIYNSSDSSASENNEISELILRDYQIRLAQPALLGKNTMIVAPTNSGKTHVAMYIAHNHLSINKDHRVVFIVDRVNLVDQQYKQFSTYFKSVTAMYGGFCPIPLVEAIKKFQIIVLTADIVKNALLTNSTTCDKFLISSTTMLIFDECHHCTKDHTYNIIMDHYYKEIENNQTTSRKPPIIVGLTASPGTDKANSNEDALQHLITVCSNLHCYEITFLNEEEFKNEMEKIDLKKFDTNSENISVPMRVENYLSQQIQLCMKDCERLLINLNDEQVFKPEACQYLTIPFARRGQSEYTNFIGNLPKILQFVKHGDVKVAQLVECIRRYLDVLNRALVVYFLFREDDVINYIHKKIHFDQPDVLMEETALKNKIQERILNTTQNEFEENPCLEILYKKIREQFTLDGDSRILVFVRERYFTHCLKSCFEEDPRLSHIPADCILGASASSGISSSTNSQKQILEKFADGQIKLLFSTTVTEEGLDVKKCNLVIRYDHVTNEIAMVQSRGRTRKEKSNYILIFPVLNSWLGLKEETNETRNKMMIHALKTFLQYPEEERMRKVNLEINKRNPLRETKQIVKLEKENVKKNETVVYQLLCRKCKVFACKSTDIFKMNNQFVCVDTSFVDRAEFKSLEKNICLDIQRIGKYFCLNCSEKWAIAAILSSVQRIILPIKNFTIQKLNANGSACSEGGFINVNKWKAVPFHVEVKDPLDFE